MAKPTSKPDWTVGNPNFATVTVEPTAGKKENGFDAGERPARETFNWLFYNVDEWIDYLEGVTDNLLVLQNFYDAVVGTDGDFATLADMVADAAYTSGDIKNVLITSDQALSAPITLDQDDLNLDFKPGVSINKGGSNNKGIIVDASRVRIRGGRFANFSTASDIALEIAATASGVIVSENFFLNNDTDINDLGATNVVLSNNIVE